MANDFILRASRPARVEDLVMTFGTGLYHMTNLPITSAKRQSSATGFVIVLSDSGVTEMWYWVQEYQPPGTTILAGS